KHSLGTGNGFFDDPCGPDNWVRAATNDFQQEIEDIRDLAVKAWLAAAAVIAFDPLPSDKADAGIAQGGAQDPIGWAGGLIVILEYLRDHVISGTALFGDTVAALTNFLADNDLFPIYRAIYEKIARSLHGDSSNPKTAISYAIMDEHDYLNAGCTAPGDSIEVFLDGPSPTLTDFIDRVITRVNELADGDLDNGAPAAFGGYISLRFMSQASAFIAPQKWPSTCSIEIAGLTHGKGTEPLLKQVEADAVEFKAALHWGQRNNWLMRDAENVHSPFGPWGDLFRWRDALSQLTDHGRWDAFSTPFSKQVGLEI